jgi:hypothetical protein
MQAPVASFRLACLIITKHIKPKFGTIDPEVLWLWVESFMNLMNNKLSK